MNSETDFQDFFERHTNTLPVEIFEIRSIHYHQHDEYELIYAKEQPVRCLINGQQMVLEPGMGLILQPGDLHMLDTPSSTAFYVIVVPSSFWSARSDSMFFDGKLRFQSVLNPQVPEDQNILALFERIVSCYCAKDYGYEFVLRSLVSCVFAELLARHMYKPYERTKKLNKNTFSDILAYIHQNYMHALTLERLVLKFHYSKSYIIRLFHENANMTPTEFINRYRIDKAKELLYLGTGSVLEVAMECGFQNVSYFTRSFKKYTGITPGAFRTQCHGTDDGSQT